MEDNIEDKKEDNTEAKTNDKDEDITRETSKPIDNVNTIRNFLVYKKKKIQTMPSPQLLQVPLVGQHVQFKAYHPCTIIN